MPEYRRYFMPGGTYFFTVVTHKRRRILTSATARQCLREAIAGEQTKRPFDIVGLVLLPEHLHTIWTLPQRDTNYSLRLQKIKENFTRSFLAAGGTESPQGSSREQRRVRGVWQLRFWEHTCRDEEDLKRCLDYLHWNPVKHGLVRSVEDYPWSSFHRYCRLGEYDPEWGGVNPCPGFEMPELGP